MYNEENNTNNIGDPNNEWRPYTGTYFNDINPENKETKKSKKKKTVGMGKLVTACAATGIVTVLLSSTVMYGLVKNELDDSYMKKTDYKAASIQNTSAALSNISVTDSDDENSQEYTVEQVAEAVLPSVVSITSTAIVQSNYNPFYGGGTYQVTGAGSGIIIAKSDTELLIVTNNHVVEDTTSLTVEFVDGSTVESTYIKGTDSKNDVAVVAIKIEDLSEETAQAIRIATLGDSESLSVGENVVAIGNALGYGQSVTSGVVSALNRTISLESGDMTVIQTDASINGGNSGGALVNRQGEVVGINVAKASNSSSSSASVEGMGYAIPISEVKDIINELMNREVKQPVAESERGYIGITSSSYVEVDSQTSQIYNIPEGIYIRELNDDTPIKNAGIVEGDVITAVEGVEVKTFDELKEQVSYYAAGETITLTVQVRGERRYHEEEIEVTLISLEELNNRL